jgi:hypothetical protein
LVITYFLANWSSSILCNSFLKTGLLLKGLSPDPQILITQISQSCSLFYKTEERDSFDYKCSPTEAKRWGFADVEAGMGSYILWNVCRMSEL